MQDTAAKLMEFQVVINVYIPYVILLNFLAVFLYSALTFGAQTKAVSPLPANLFRLVSLVVSTLLVTLLFGKYILDTLTVPAVIFNIIQLSLPFQMAVFWLYLWLKGFDIRYVLSTLIISVILLLVVCIVQLRGLTELCSPLIWLTLINSIAAILTHFISFEDFIVFQLFNKRLERYVWYKPIMEHAKADNSLALHIACGLTINMHSLIYIIKVVQSSEWLGYALMVICGCSIAYQTMLAIGLCALCQNGSVKYRWNFMIQSYINLYVTFRKVWYQTHTGSLPPKLSLMNLYMAFVLIAIQSPLVGYCSGVEFPMNTEGSSNEFTSDGESSDLFGQKNKPGPGNKAVGEGATVTKYGKAAKPYVDYAAREAREVGKEVAQSLRRQGIDKVTGGALVAVGCVGALTLESICNELGFKLPTLPDSARPDIRSLELEKQIALQKALNQEIERYQLNQKALNQEVEQFQHNIKGIGDNLKEMLEVQKELNEEIAKGKELRKPPEWKKD